MARMQLTEDNMEEVVGGAYWFRTHTREDGTEYMTCEVDNVGTFFCSDNAKKQLAKYLMKQGVDNVSVNQLVQWALDNHYFWN